MAPGWYLYQCECVDGYLGNGLVCIAEPTDCESKCCSDTNTLAIEYDFCNCSTYACPTTTVLTTTENFGELCSFIDFAHQNNFFFTACLECSSITVFSQCSYSPLYGEYPSFGNETSVRTTFEKSGTIPYALIYDEPTSVLIYLTLNFISENYFCHRNGLLDHQDNHQK